MTDVQIDTSLQLPSDIKHSKWGSETVL